jgi:hypothetical protein
MNIPSWRLGQSPAGGDSRIEKALRFRHDPMIYTEIDSAVTWGVEMPVTASGVRASLHQAFAAVDMACEIGVTLLDHADSITTDAPPWRLDQGNWLHLSAVLHGHEAKACSGCLRIFAGLRQGLSCTWSHS